MVVGSRSAAGTAGAGVEEVVEDVVSEPEAPHALSTATTAMQRLSARRVDLDSERHRTRDALEEEVGEEDSLESNRELITVRPDERVE